MKKSLLLTLSIGAVFATSCSLFAKNKWSWDVSTKGNRINYCLLIGQLDHDDSMQRTGGIRDMLDTRPDKAHQKSNKNLEDPKVGHLTLGGNNKVTVTDPDGTQKTYEAAEKTFEVHELEHGEQKSLAGSNWDPITANASTGTWISKHGKNITMFVSNNDGMSEGAIKSYNWYQGMPIFGYDANMSTLELVDKDRIMGTVDSTTYGQALATAILTRNIYEATRKIYPNDKGDYAVKYSRVDWLHEGWGDPLIEDPENNGHLLHEDEEIQYDPTDEGFIKYTLDENGRTNEDPHTGDVHYPLIDENGLAYKKQTSDKAFASGIATGHMQSPINYDEKTHAVMLRNRALTREAIEGGYKDPTTGEIFESDSIHDFFNKEGEGLSYPEIYDKFEGPGVDEKKKTNPITFEDITKEGANSFEPLQVWQSWGIGSDPYFKTNMNLHFDTVFGGRNTTGGMIESPYQKLHPETGRMFNFSINPAEGDGSDEKKLLDALDSALSRGNCKAFLINLIRQPNTAQYLMKLRDKLNKSSPIPDKDNWIERDDTPVIFWNRRPTNEDTKPYPLSENKNFKFVYYVGFDAEQGGRLQGSLIRDWLNRYYVMNKGHVVEDPVEAINNENK